MLISFSLGASLTFWHRKVVMGWLFAPAHGLLSPTGQPIFTAPTEIFQFVVHLSIWGGVVVAAPVAVFHIARLLSPLVSGKVRRFLAIFLPAAFVFYLTGAAFAYFVLLPTGFRFLLSFGAGAAVAYIRVSEYMELAIAMMFWLGVVFELPLGMFLGVKMGAVEYERLRMVRRYVPPTAIILGAIITPTVDIINMTLVAVPIIVLYEVGLLLAWLAKPRQRKLRRSLVEDTEGVE